MMQMSCCWDLVTVEATGVELIVTSQQYFQQPELLHKAGRFQGFMLFLENSEPAIWMLQLTLIRKGNIFVCPFLKSLCETQDQLRSVSWS